MRLEIEGGLFALRVGKSTVASGALKCYHGHWTLRDGHVHPKHRGHGYQRMLIRARLKRAREKGAKRVLVWAKPTNSYSLNNLVAEGFRFMATPMKEFNGARHVGLECVF